MSFETDVSIVICTRNRAQSLRSTLDVISRVVIPERLNVELIVADNGSTDETRQVVEQARIPGVGVRYLREGAPGKSRAYNTAISAAGGRILLFTDDDLRPDADWVESMCRPILQEKAGVVQGAVRLPAHLERPWMAGFLRSFVAVGEAGGSDGPADLVGANLAVCRSVFELVPQFDVELGPGTRLALGEDTLFGRQLKASGVRVCFAAGGVVEHHFEERRLEPAAFLTGVANSGRAAAYIDYHWEHKRVSVPGLRKAFYGAKRLLRAALTPNRRRRGVPGWEAVYVCRAAYFDEYSRMKGEPYKYDRHGLRKLPA